MKEFLERIIERLEAQANGLKAVHGSTAHSTQKTEVVLREAKQTLSRLSAPGDDEKTVRQALSISKIVGVAGRTTRQKTDRQKGGMMERERIKQIAFEDAAATDFEAEWLASRVLELEKENAELRELLLDSHPLIQLRRKGKEKR